MQSRESVGVGRIDVGGQVEQAVHLVLVAGRHGRQEGAVDGERDGLDVLAYGRLTVGVRFLPSFQLFGSLEQRRHGGSVARPWRTTRLAKPPTDAATRFPRPTCPPGSALIFTPQRPQLERTGRFPCRLFTGHTAKLLGHIGQPSVRREFH